MAKFKVTFIIEGELLADDVDLDEDNLERGIKSFFDKELANEYYGNRCIDTRVFEITIEPIKEE